MVQLLPGALNNISKRLLQTPSPSSSGKGKRSNTKGKKKISDSGSKKPRHSGIVILKVKLLISIHILHCVRTGNVNNVNVHL